jgi:hypothetical protein
MRKYLLVFLLANLAAMPVMAGPAVHKAAAPAVKRPAAPAGNTAALNAYLNRLRAKLINGWLVPDGKNNVVVSATLNNDGTVEAFDTQGGDASGKQSANDAFAKAQPFEALPAGVNKAKVKLSFISTADPHGDSSSNVVTEMTPVAEPKPQPQTAPSAAPAAEQK